MTLGRFFAVSLISWGSIATAQPELFYDAQQAYFTQDGTRQTFNGNVVVIGGGYVIAADHISINRQTGLLEAHGNIVAVSADQTLTAATARYWLKTRDFVVTDAQIVISDPVASTKLRAQMLARGADKKKQAYRQQLWQQTRHANQHSTKQSYYLKFHSNHITRYDKDKLQAQQAFLTPCRCAADEPPAFALRARHINATIDEHIDFNHAVIEVHGLPVFFVPSLRIPLTRQSGLLFPSLAHHKHTGLSFSQPLYFAFNEQTDATFYLDLLQRRGVRIAASTRGYFAPQQHWHLFTEGLHDRHAQKNNAPYWRGTLKWRGLHALTPYLTVGSMGDVSSDIAYNHTLYRTRRDEAEFNIMPYASSRLWLHADYPDVYLGINSHVATASEIFTAGEQLPLSITLQSRHLQLIDLPFLQTWTHLQLNQHHLGTWQRQHLHQQAQLHLTNVLLGTVFDIEQFWELATKRLHDKNNSNLHTWRSGVRVSLPLDGHLRLPTQGEHTRWLQHLVRLNAGITLQPQVHSTGYFRPEAQVPYFAADRLKPSEVLALEVEQAWRLTTQTIPTTELAGPRRNQPPSLATHTPVSLRLSTTWDRQQAKRRAAAQQQGIEELPPAWSPLQLDVRLQHGTLSLRQELAWNIYQRRFEQLRLALTLPLSATVQLTPGWEIVPQAVDARATALQRVQVRRLGLVAQLAQHTQLQIAYADRKPLQDEGQRQYRWQIGGEYRAQQECWGLAFSRLKDWHDDERDASYMLSLQVNFVNSPSYNEEG